MAHKIGQSLRWLTKNFVLPLMAVGGLFGLALGRIILEEGRRAPDWPVWASLVIFTLAFCATAKLSGWRWRTLPVGVVAVLMAANLQWEVAHYLSEAQGWEKTKTFVAASAVLALAVTFFSTAAAISRLWSAGRLLRAAQLIKDGEGVVRIPPHL